MTFSKIGRILVALVATAALGLGMTACGGGTIGYIFVAGSYYNQVSGFKIDDYTGNLTPIDPHTVCDRSQQPDHGSGEVERALPVCDQLRHTAYGGTDQHARFQGAD